MPDPRQPPPENAPSRDARARRAIVEATASVCAQKGYPDTTVGDVAARAQIDVDSFLKVFPDVEEAFIELLSVEEHRLLGQVEEACVKTDDPASRIERGLRATLRWVDENPRDARVCIVEPTRATRRVFERREQALERLADLLRSTAPPAPSAVPALFEELLVAGVCEVLGGRLRDGEPGRAIDLAPELAELLLGPYFPPSTR